MISYENILKDKALDLLAQMPPIIQVDPNCYRYHNHYGYFAWVKTPAAIVPILVSITARSEPLLADSFEFAIRQQYCRYYDRNPLVLNLLDKTPQAANEYFKYGYDIETFINIYQDVPIYRVNYLLDTPPEVALTLHALDTFPLDAATGLKTKMALLVKHAAVQQLPSLTSMEIMQLKQQTQHHKLPNNKIAPLSTLMINQSAQAPNKLVKLPNAANSDIIAQLRQNLQWGQQQCQTVNNNPVNVKLNLQTLIDDLLIGSISDQVVAHYATNAALTLRLTLSSGMQLTAYRPNGQVYQQATGILTESMPKLLKQLVKKADENGLIALAEL